jgi:hypothetical protein
MQFPKKVRAWRFYIKWAVYIDGTPPVFLLFCVLGKSSELTHRAAILTSETIHQLLSGDKETWSHIPADPCTQLAYVHFLRGREVTSVCTSSGKPMRFYILWSNVHLWRTPYICLYGTFWDILGVTALACVVFCCEYFVLFGWCANMRVPVWCSSEVARMYNIHMQL